MVANSLHNRWLGRRLPSLVRGGGFDIEQFSSHGFVETTEAEYMLTIVDRGTDILRLRADRRGDVGGTEGGGASSGGGGSVLRAYRLREPYRPQAHLTTSLRGWGKTRDFSVSFSAFFSERRRSEVRGAHWAESSGVPVQLTPFMGRRFRGEVSISKPAPTNVRCPQHAARGRRRVVRARRSCGSSLDTSGANGL